MRRVTPPDPASRSSRSPSSRCWSLACGDRGTPSPPAPRPRRRPPRHRASAVPTPAPRRPRRHADGPSASPRRLPHGPSRPRRRRASTLEAVVGGLDSPLWVEPRCPTAAAGCSSPSRAAGSASSRTASAPPTPFLDISDRDPSGGERGLLGRRVPARLRRRSDPRVYVHYSDHDGRHHHRRASTPRAGDARRSTRRTERVILTEPQPYANHNGGWIGFDADRDAADRPGRRRRRRRPGEPRLEPRRRSWARCSGSTSSARPAAQAVRDPGRQPVRRPRRRPPRDPPLRPAQPVPRQRRPGDRATCGSATSGQSAWEEVDVAPAGARGLDFGWRRWEGRHCYDPPTGLRPDRRHDAGHGVRARRWAARSSAASSTAATAIPALRGAYLFSDYCSGTLWAIDAGLDAASRRRSRCSRPVASISSIGIDDAGEVVHHGPLRRRAGAAGRPPRPEPTAAPTPRRRAQPGCKRATDFVDRRMIGGRSPCAGERPTGWNAHAFRRGELESSGGAGPHRWSASHQPLRRAAARARGRSGPSLVIRGLCSCCR